jgi:hypothetical protein
LGAFLYISLGMGPASHNQPAMVSGLRYLASTMASLNF